MLAGLSAIVAKNRMAHAQRLYVVSVVFGLSIAWTAVAQTASAEPKSWLLQTVQIGGDIREGFRKTCLVVYSNGEYHRERRRQLSRYGRAEFDWEEPQVFEAKLNGNDFDALKAILETPEFAAINGAVGDARSLRPSVAVGPQGAVRPEENIEIVTVAVARPNAPQVFEVADMNLARRQATVRVFLDWINDTEQSQGHRLPASQSTNCSPSITTGNASAGGAPMSTGMTPPKAIYTPAPRPPQGKPKPQPVGVELLVGPDGSVAEASLKGRPGTDVAQSALDTVRKWKFQPARLLGVPIATRIDVKIEFRSK